MTESTESVEKHGETPSLREYLTEKATDAEKYAAHLRSRIAWNTERGDEYNMSFNDGYERSASEADVRASQFRGYLEDLMYPPCQFCGSKNGCHCENDE